MDVALDAALEAELQSRVKSLGTSLVVRSSSPLEGSGRWAGAFTSYVGIAPDQIGVAVRGCWASAYARDVLERCEREGIDPESLRLAVLIQPAIEFETGGAARVEQDDTVRITATRGSPAALMTGWVAGEEIVVEPNSTVPADGSRVLGAEGLIAIASLARRVRALHGDSLIEWGAHPDFGVLLLQSKREPRAPPAPPAEAAPDDSTNMVAAVRLARLVRRFPGWLGEEVVLPWAILVPDDAVPDADALPIAAAVALQEARALARRLCASVWKVDGETAFATAMRAIEDVRSANASAELLQRIEHGEHTDQADAARIVGLLRAAERDGEPNTAPPRDRWEPFLFATLRAYGESRAASPVVSGIGAGRARFSDVPGPAPRERDRKVLVVPRPLPAFAPLLWNAAGLVSIAGGTGAHLMEIARSLAVPTVMNCRLDDLVAQGADRYLLGVDGDRGCVSVLPLRG
jgi:phosphohistidine swiveling domain-containing protein